MLSGLWRLCMRAKVDLTVPPATASHGGSFEGKDARLRPLGAGSENSGLAPDATTPFFAKSQRTRLARFASHQTSGPNPPTRRPCPPVPPCSSQRVGAADAMLARERWDFASAAAVRAQPVRFAFGAQISRAASSLVPLSSLLPRTQPRSAPPWAPAAGRVAAGAHSPSLLPPPSSLSSPIPGVYTAAARPDEVQWRVPPARPALPPSLITEALSQFASVAILIRCGSGPSGPEPSGWLINQLGNPSFMSLNKNSVWIACLNGEVL